MAYGPDGASIATFLRRQAGARPVIDVRDETGAPVAALRAAPGGAGAGLVLVETGGGALARVTYGEYDNEGWVDDEWSLRPLVSLDRLPLQPMAAVALVLGAKVLLGRVSPARVQSPGRFEHRVLRRGRLPSRREWLYIWFIRSMSAPTQPLKRAPAERERRVHGRVRVGEVVVEPEQCC